MLRHSRVSARSLQLGETPDQSSLLHPSSRRGGSDRSVGGPSCRSLFRPVRHMLLDLYVLPINFLAQTVKITEEPYA
jgi:hypothetical protein